MYSDIHALHVLESVANLLHSGIQEAQSQISPSLIIICAPSTVVEMAGFHIAANALKKAVMYRFKMHPDTMKIALESEFSSLTGCLKIHTSIHVTVI